MDVPKATVASLPWGVCAEYACSGWAKRKCRGGSGLHLGFIFRSQLINQEWTRVQEMDFCGLKVEELTW